MTIDTGIFTATVTMPDAPKASDLTGPAKNEAVFLRRVRLRQAKHVR